jgi:hypothetical protein
MPAQNASPEEKRAYLRAYREKRMAERRCVRCGADLPTRETRQCCPACCTGMRTQVQERREQRRRERASERWKDYANRPYPVGGAGEPLGERKRDYSIMLDAESLAAVDALKARAVREAGRTLPYGTSQVVRAALRGLAGVQVPTRRTSPGGVTIQMGFTADAATRSVINQHIIRTERRSLTAAIRDLLVYAAFGAGGSRGIVPPQGCWITTIDGETETREWFADEEPAERPAAS